MLEIKVPGTVKSSGNLFLKGVTGQGGSHQKMKNPGTVKVPGSFVVYAVRKQGRGA